MSHLRVPACSFLLLFSVFTTAQPKPVSRNTATPEARTASYLSAVREQPSLLLSFLRTMPKGGDLHNHLPGAVYAEDFIRWAAEDGLCINRQSFAFAPRPCEHDKNLAPATQILEEPALYQSVINALSMRSFNGPESGHDHFFNTFLKFGAVSKNHTGDMLAAMMAQAAADNVSYIEVITGLDQGEADRRIKEDSFSFEEPDPGSSRPIADLRERLMKAVIPDAVKASISNLNDAEIRAKHVLHCETADKQPGCNVTVLYQYEVLRGLPPVNVFAGMLIGMELASKDPRIVSINPVMPEDAYVPMHDFDLHMRMIDYLHGVYPKVHLSLHAGELWTGLVPPSGLRDHIRKSIDLGHAQRIGHGVDVMFEDDPIGLLKEMAAKKVAVEINLVSNDQILGVRGDEHPFLMYLRYDVPVAISTDDEGVSRSNMTEQYLRAVRDYRLSYPTLKKIVRNSLEYSFIPGQSLWKDASYSQFATSCATQHAETNNVSSSCRDFLKNNQKARLQWELEADFGRFEAKSCCIAAPNQAHSVR